MNNLSYWALKRKRPDQFCCASEHPKENNSWARNVYWDSEDGTLKLASEQHGDSILQYSDHKRSIRADTIYQTGPSKGSEKNKRTTNKKGE